MEATDIIEKEHSKYSPSGYKMIKSCPGYISDGKAPLHPNTIEGTLIHDCLEKEEYSRLDDDQYRLAMFCKKTEQRLAPRFIDLDLAHKAVVEIKLTVNEKHQSWGYTDKAYIQGDKAIVFDWKFGWIKIDDAENNYQGKGYVLGLFNQFPELKEVQMVFVQPRLRHVTSVVYNVEEILGMSEEIDGLLEAAERFDKWVTPSSETDKQLSAANPSAAICQFCGRRLSCPVMRIFMQDTLSKLEGLGAPSSFDLTEINNRPSELIKIVQAKTIIDKLIEDAKDRLISLVEDGNEIPGVTVYERAAPAKIEDIELAAKVCSGLGISTQEFLSAAKVSITALTDVVKGKTERGAKTAAADLLKASLAKAGAIAQGEPSKVLRLK